MLYTGCTSRPAATTLHCSLRPSLPTTSHEASFSRICSCSYLRTSVHRGRPGRLGLCQPRARMAPVNAREKHAFNRPKQYHNAFQYERAVDNLVIVEQQRNHTKAIPTRSGLPTTGICPHAGRLNTYPHASGELDSIQVSLYRGRARTRIHQFDRQQPSVQDYMPSYRGLHSTAVSSFWGSVSF
jgi:hypothetical protein